MVGEAKPLAALTALTWNRQLAFALLVFERMLPSMVAFSKDTGRDPSCYLLARDAAWAALQNGQDNVTYRQLNEACLKNAPDTEEFSHKLTSHALNATLTMSDILEFIVDRGSDHIARISTLATDSVALYLSGLEPSLVYSPERGQRMAAHPLMRHELRRQEEDIAFLCGLAEHFDKDTISALRARARSQPPLLPVTER